MDKLVKEDFSLYNINKDIDDKISNQGKNDLDFCRMIVNALDENLSVTAEYDSPESFI